MSQSIEELRQRWEEDPSPQLSLQLAEEYRRLDRRKDAVHILSLALGENPDHVAARVALGRYQYEMGEFDEACGLLEDVVNEDPTHLVASKLLVSLYLDRGDDRQARDRLDLYKLLNESDPEIESLEAGLRGERPVAPPAAVLLDVPRNGDPFKGLGTETDGASYWQALGSEGIFPTAGRAMPVHRQPTVVLPKAEPPVATVTLANLYLQQGHLEDAEKTLGEVLAREPTSVEAQAGLAEITRRRNEDLAVVEPATTSAAPESVDAPSRKIEVLHDYLRRIRAASNQS